MKQNRTDMDELAISEDWAKNEDIGGATRDKVAKEAGLSSGKTYERGKKIILEADKLKEEGREDDAELLIYLLNNKSVSATADLANEAILDSLSKDEKQELNDFELSGMGVTVDIDVYGSQKVFNYLKVLRRVGKVKGLLPSNDDWPGDDTALCYNGNSNGIKFMLYDLDALLSIQAGETYFNIGQPEYSEGILRTEVKLTKPKALRAYTNKSSISKQIADLHDNRQQIFLDTFMRIIPFGNFYKKDKAEEIIRTKVKDTTIRRKMLWLVGLIPEKKSLLSAQKALNYRRIDKVMKAFFDIEVAPITISKRHEVKKLDNLYNYL